MNRIQGLLSLGQSVWLDYISRSLISTGELKRLAEDGVTGLTSNPTIFQKSICETTDYDEALKSIMKANPAIGPETVYETLAIEDIRMAADVLRPIYEASDGADGFVSLEVSPHFANLTAVTISEAERLWKAVSRPNLMIKVPATREGIPAVEELISEGINVNVTLIFSLSQYADVAHAYIRGLQGNPSPHRVASVASFFVSRIDTAVDKALEQKDRPEALALRGRIAVASCKMVYLRFQEIFSGDLFNQQRKRGSRVQRPLWGSTGTKNPAYSDVIYVDGLIGADTVNTVPMPTLKAFLDHGRVEPALSRDAESARDQLRALAGLGIDLTSITNKLLKDGVQAFVDSFDRIMDSLKDRCSIK
jgi:transaldolase